MWATGRTDPARGLTLIELVVVVAILAILALPVTLRLGSGGLWQAPPPLQAAATRLVAEVEAARDRALLARRAEVLQPHPDGWTLGGAEARFPDLVLDWRQPVEGPVRLLADRRGTPFAVVLQAGPLRQRCAFDGWGPVTCDAPG